MITHCKIMLVQFFLSKTIALSVCIFLFVNNTIAQDPRTIAGDSILKNALKKNQPLPWITVKDCEDIDPGYDKNAIRKEHKELMESNQRKLAKFRSLITEDITINFVKANPVGLLYQVENSGICISLFIRIVENKQGVMRLLLLDIDTSQVGLSYQQRGKLFEGKNDNICILYYQKALQQKSSVQDQRRMYYFLARNAYDNGYYEDAIGVYRKIAKTDNDTLLVAAEAYGWIALIYKYYIIDSIKMRNAEEMQLSYLDMSVNLYPNNIPAYITKLNFYKFSSLEKGKEEFFQLLRNNFNDEWRITYALANYYITDFLSSSDKNYTIARSYLVRTIELNPSSFNSYLLICSDDLIGEKERLNYLKKMYALAPEQFKKNSRSNSEKNAFLIQSEKDKNGKDLFLTISRNEYDFIHIK
jgi:hypothetical protein